MKWFYKDRGDFEAKSKGYEATLKKEVDRTFSGNEWRIKEQEDKLKVLWKPFLIVEFWIKLLFLNRWNIQSIMELIF